MRNKKGIIFTTLVVLILSLFVIAAYTSYSKVDERKSVQKRIDTMNSFVNSVEDNIPRQLRTSGFRIIFLFEKRIVEKGQYLSNVNSLFQEAFFGGTINGESNQDIQTVMDGAKFSDIKSLLQDKANGINANLDILDANITIIQEDPWNVKVILSSNIIINDNGNLASWNKTENITAIVPIQNFEDPLYIINTNGLVINKIMKTNFLSFVSGSDISNLLVHAQNSYYINSTLGPSFLDRLEGKTSPNIYGIESLVNLDKLSSKGISTRDKSVVDYIYFSGANPAACNVIPVGMPFWFKLDNAHLSIYQVSCP